MRKIINFINPVDEVKECLLQSSKHHARTFSYLESHKPHRSADLILLSFPELKIQRNAKEFDFIPFIVYGEPELISRAFALGASDYIKPLFSIQELESRAMRIINEDKIEVLGKTVQFSLTELNCRGIHVPITVSEYRILNLLSANSGRVVSRQSILYRLEAGEDVSRSLDVHINSLRNKLNKVIENPQAGRALIHTVRGEGYTINPHSTCG